MEPIDVYLRERSTIYTSRSCGCGWGGSKRRPSRYVWWWDWTGFSLLSVWFTFAALGMARLVRFFVDTQHQRSARQTLITQIDSVVRVLHSNRAARVNWSLKSYKYLNKSLLYRNPSKPPPPPSENTYYLNVLYCTPAVCFNGKGWESEVFRTFLLEKLNSLAKGQLASFEKVNYNIHNFVK